MQTEAISKITNEKKDKAYARKLGFSGEAWIFLQVWTCKYNIFVTQASKSHLQMDNGYVLPFQVSR